MHRFIVLYRTSVGVAERLAQAGADQAAQGSQAWADWAARLGPALLEPGTPLGNSTLVGPIRLTPKGSDVIAISVLRAGCMAEALDLVNDRRHLHWAGPCEITVLEELVAPGLDARLQ